MSRVTLSSSSPVSLPCARGRLQVHMPRYSAAIYISSGLAANAARAAAAAAAIPRVAVVDTFTDVAYARSSVKIVAEPEPLLQAAEAAAAEALNLVDLAQGTC